MDKEKFDIPVVIFIFRRLKAVEVMKRIAQIKPNKLYILSDNGRNESEREEVKKCREIVENEIDWECEVIKNYATENRGVYGNISLGAKWVFEREEMAIFLEDDNLPELSFFDYCKELLEKYKEDTRILWICGTNYLGEYQPKEDVSYVFTKHMLPCGWASWSHKFNRFYDGELRLYSKKEKIEIVRKNHYNNRLFNQFNRAYKKEYTRISNNDRPASWDFQMDFAIKLHGLYGIAPIKNQIKNIGVDKYSIHGGIKLNTMTKRFTKMHSFPLSFPLKHPAIVAIDEKFEKKIYRIIVYPLRVRANNLKIKIMRRIKRNEK